jgi:hypothetical protein
MPVAELSALGYGEIAMPYVNIRITKDGATPDQKAQLIKGATQLLVQCENPRPVGVVMWTGCAGPEWAWP